MIVYRVLDEVFSTWSNIAVMRALRYSQDGMTGRAIAKTAGMSPRAGLASGFTAFVANDKGQRIILKTGVLPYTQPVRLVRLKDN